MFCEKCGKELREGVKFCPGCGKVIENATSEQHGQVPAVANGKGKLIVYGYTQWFAVKPKVDVMKNGIKVAEVYPSSKTEIDIEQDCTITFKCMFRTAVIQAKAGVTQEIQLSFDRITGDLLAMTANGSVAISQQNKPVSAAFNANNVGNYNTSSGKKNKTVAGLLGIFLGGLGIHKFYMGRHGQGILYLLLCWTYVPAIIGFVEGIIYFADSDEKFNSRCI